MPARRDQRHLHSGGREARPCDARRRARREPRRRRRDRVLPAHRSPRRSEHEPRCDLPARAAVCRCGRRARRVRWRQPDAYLQPHARRLLRLRHRRRRGRQDPAQARPWGHPLRPARDQQDRPRAIRPLRPGGDGARCASSAPRATVRLHELLHRRRARRGHPSHRPRRRSPGRRSMTAVARPRRDPAWYTLSALPGEVVALDRAVDGALGVGAPGKVGLLELSLAPSGGLTRVQRQYQQAPLHVYRPIYLDAGRPDMAFIFVQQFGDGFVQGDRCRVDVDCAPRSAVHITTQAATNVFAARENFATQLVNLRTGAGAVLEYLPDPVVPFAGSRLVQHVSVTADPTSTVILGETLLPGRVARGEAHAYDLYCAHTEVGRPDGKPLFADTLRLNPADGVEPRSIGLLGPHDVVATLFVVTAEIGPAALVSLFRDALAGCPDIFAGASELPDGCGAVARLLGPNSKTVRAALRTLWNEARRTVLGVPAPDLRKG